MQRMYALAYLTQGRSDAATSAKSNVFLTKNVKKNHENDYFQVEFVIL